ncbi:hypothetical protein ABIH81_16135 [Micromonospora sp. HUAS YX12]|uniref:Uncharacterized protein n=1 Tax=Micromonospora sp. HUAS YX12 TaxID=3156396 RepID=A0AAU7QSN8_9ACTN
MRIDIDEPRAAELFWEGMREVAAGAARHQDDDLYRAIVKIGRSGQPVGAAVRPVSPAWRYGEKRRFLRHCGMTEVV